MIEKYVKGCIPIKTLSKALVSNASLKCFYEVNSIETGSPLRKIIYNENEINWILPKGWFLDLDVRELDNMDFVKSNGRGIFRSMDWKSVIRKNAVTHYYLHLHDLPCIVIYHVFHRLSEKFQETLKFNKNIEKFYAGDRFFRLDDRGIYIIFNKSINIDVEGNEVRFIGENKRYGYIICFNKLFKNFLPLSIDLEPDITKPGSYLKKNEEVEIKINVKNIPKNIGNLEIRLYGLTSLKHIFSTNQDIYQFSFKFKPKYAGIIPLLILVNGDGFLYFSLFEVLVLPTTVTSPDHRFNGVFVEYIRSMLQRKIFNIVPEEDPRGEMLYHHGFWPRNLYAYDLFCFGFQELGIEMVKVFGYLLEKYRFLFDSYSLDGREVFSNPLVSISNDGIGFYLFQVGKILIRRPDLFDDDFKRGLEKAITWLDYCTHWNGLLVDKTEAVDHCRSERLAGNPYSQSICMAGLKIISKILEKLGERELSERAKKVFERQLTGFKNLYSEIGYFRDIIYSGKPRLSTYSMPAPGCFLLDPEVEEYSLQNIISNIMEIIKSKCTEPDNPWIVTGGTGCLGTSYAQLGTVAAFLNLNNIDDAWRFLNEILKYAESTSLKYILPEKVVLKSYREKYEKAKREHKERASWLYTKVSERLPGWPCNPGNLVHMSYYLYIVDLICGISRDRPICNLYSGLSRYIDCGVRSSPSYPLRIIISLTFMNFGCSFISFGIFTPHFLAMFSAPTTSAFIYLLHL